MTQGSLPITGERTVPGVWHENYWYRRHEAAYRFLLPYAAVRSLLEIGAGEGYGAALFASVAVRVVAIDYDAASVRHAAGRYTGRRSFRPTVRRCRSATGHATWLLRFR